MSAQNSDPTGLHRVLDDRVVLPQAAARLDTRRELWPDEVRIRVERLNLDAASFRQLERKHAGDGAAVRAEVLDIVATRGKMQNPETGSGGMLIGTVEEVGPDSTLGLSVGDRVATLVSLTLTPLVIEDGLAGWDGRGEQVPADGYAILFGRSIAAVLPDRPSPRPRARGDGRLWRARADRPGRGGVRRPRGRGRGRGRQVRFALAGRRPGRRRLPHHRGGAARGRRRPCSRAPAWPTRSSSRTRGTRWRCARPSRPPGDRPT